MEENLATGSIKSALKLIKPIAGIQEKASRGTVPRGSFNNNFDLANGRNDFYLRFDHSDFKKENDRIRALTASGELTAIQKSMVLDSLKNKQKNTGKVLVAAPLFFYHS